MSKSQKSQPQKNHSSQPKADAEKRVRKPLTAEQRARKNRKDRERRRRARAAAKTGVVCESGKKCKSAKSGVSCSGCPSSGKVCGGRCRNKCLPVKVETKSDRLDQIAKAAVEVAERMLSGDPVLFVPTESNPMAYERSLGPGVTRRIICLPGHTIDMTVVDESVSHHKLRRELEKQFLLKTIEDDIGEIVERQRDAE